MKQKDNIKEELKAISPFLDGKLSKKQGYTVPKNYFKQLPNELMKQAVYQQPGIAQKTGSTKRNAWWKILFAAPMRYKTMAGLGLGLLLLMVNVFSKTEENPYQHLSQLSAVEVSQYLDENIDHFELEDLVEANIVSNQDFDFENVNQMDAELINTYLEDIEFALDEDIDATISL